MFTNTLYKIQKHDDLHFCLYDELIVYKDILIFDVKNIHWKTTKLTLLTSRLWYSTIKCAYDIFDKTENVKSSTLIEGATSLAHYVV